MLRVGGGMHEGGFRGRITRVSTLLTTSFGDCYDDIREGCEF